MCFLVIRFLQQVASSSPLGQSRLKSQTLLSSMKTPPQSNHDGGLMVERVTEFSVTEIKDEKLQRDYSIELQVTL